MAETREPEALCPGTPSKDIDVDERAAGQSETYGLATDLDVLADEPPQVGESPTQRTERIVRFREKKVRDPYTRGRNTRAHEVCEEAPGLVSPGTAERHTVPLDPGRSEQVDANAQGAARITRSVTRPTVIFLLVCVNTFF
jgi:hypothetical protein